MHLKDTSVLLKQIAISTCQNPVHYLTPSPSPWSFLLLPSSHHDSCFVSAFRAAIILSGPLTLRVTCVLVLFRLPDCKERWGVGGVLFTHPFRMPLFLSESTHPIDFLNSLITIWHHPCEVPTRSVHTHYLMVNFL